MTNPARTALVGSLAALTLLASCARAAPGPAAETDRPVIRVAYNSEADLEDLPSLLAHEILREHGYTVETIFFAQSELGVQALAQGEADFGHGALRPYWAAVAEGAEVLTLMEHVANAWSIVSLREIIECADLAGRRMAQHSPGGVSKALSDAYIAQACPGVEPIELIIPGSGNRAAALLAGEIDATPLELADVAQLLAQGGDRFHILVRFAEELPGLKTSGVTVRAAFARQHPQAVTDYLQALLESHRRLAEDPGPLVTAAVEQLGLDPETAAAAVEAYMAIDAWHPNGGLDRASVAASLAFYQQMGSLPEGLTAEAVADLTYLEAALDEIGRW